jgi:hypothetical protein
MSLKVFCFYVPLGSGFHQMIETVLMLGVPVAFAKDALYCMALATMMQFCCIKVIGFYHSR